MKCDCLRDHAIDATELMWNLDQGTRGGKRVGVVEYVAGNNAGGLGKQRKAWAVMSI